MDNSTNLRSALSQFATGVAIITMAQAGRVYGMTVNSFTSVSLSPPLILWCLANDAAHEKSFRLFSAAEQFCVSILSAAQIELARRLACHDRHELPRDDVVSGSLFIRDALVGFACDVYDRKEGGDHVIIIGEVKAMKLLGAAQPPLIFHHSQYRKLE